MNSTVLDLEHDETAAADLEIPTAWPRASACDHSDASALDAFVAQRVALFGC